MYAAQTSQVAQVRAGAHDALLLVQALAQRHILSAPVISGKQEAPDEIVDIKSHADGDVLGFMDIRDILLHLLADFDDVSAMMSQPLEERIQRVQEAGARFSQLLLRDISSYGADGQFLHSGQVRI